MTGSTFIATARAVVAALIVLACAATPALAADDLAIDPRNVVPPGQAGSLPPVPWSTNQIPLYDGLTPLFDRVGEADVRRFFKPAGLAAPTGAAGVTERVPRADVRIVRDRTYGVPHVRASTRAGVMWGAGWVTARDRGILIERLRWAGRVAALDIPGVDPFNLVLGTDTIAPSRQTERFLDRQIALLGRLGSRGRRAQRDLAAYVAGVNAGLRAGGFDGPPWTGRDVAASAALVGAVFGSSGGEELRNARFLQGLRARLGLRSGDAVFADLRTLDDPAAPTTLTRRFPYGLVAAGDAPGAVVPDGDPSAAASGERADSNVRAAPARTGGSMSNALLLGARRAAGGRPLAVMGPQVSYFYPQVLMEIALDGPGIAARGVLFPGTGPYVELGRGAGHAWSATSSGLDLVDQFAVPLCNPGGSGPVTSASRGYRHRGRCRPLRRFDAGALTSGGATRRLTFDETVHGPVIATVTAGGRPYAISLRRSTRGRETASAIGFQMLNETGLGSARDFLRAASRIEMAFNWFYADGRNIAMFSSGRLPVRAPGTSASLPTLGTGRYDWRGFLPALRHPQAIDPPSGQLVNWNNKPAPGVASADTNWGWGSVYRVQMLQPPRGTSTRARAVGRMNRAATQDLRAVEVWPVIARVLRGGTPPSELAAGAARQVDAWVREGSSRLDRDGDGLVDAPGAAVLDAAWPQLADAALGPVLGPELTDQLARIIARDNPPFNGGGYQTGWWGYMAKDLRTQLGEPVRGPYSRRYCGNGDLERCRRDLWAAVADAAARLAAEQGPDPSRWRARAFRIRFEPGLLGASATMRWTNRPTFQQVMRFRRRSCAPPCRDRSTRSPALTGRRPGGAPG
jgi:acyl-homoserine lactone acylase PvdQ